jgi:two-component system OmpR family sensor kinase
MKTPRGDLLLRSENSFRQESMTIVAAAAAIIVLLSIMYWLIRRTLIPLKSLEEDIRLYGKGELKNFRHTEKEDEISRVSNAFYESARKVQRLTESRQLFIRNIFHELNTPVTKGRLLAEIAKEPKVKSMIGSIFDRLSLLLEELGEVERITASDRPVKLRPVRIVDLIDQARDRLYLEDPIPADVNEAVIMADFSSMAIVFKNLIDNALKYGTGLKIISEKGVVSFVSRGERLEHPLNHYTEAFFRPEKSRGERGFGLGLYIVREILRRHGMELRYRYAEGRNIFSIVTAPAKKP